MAHRVRKAVFPAAGLGTRFLPATKACPKEMLPLVDKPLIQYVVEETVASGIESILIVTGRGKSAIVDHFDLSPETETLLRERGQDDLLRQVRAVSELARITYVRQGEILGIGHAILRAREFVSDEPFALMLSDDIVDAEQPPLKRMTEVYQEYDAPVLCVMPVEGEAISRYGVIEFEEVADGILKVKGIVEKPAPGEAPSNLAIIGRYIFTPDIFAELEKVSPGIGGEIQAADAMQTLLKKRPFYAIRLEGKRYDAGDKLEYLIAMIELALKRSDIAPGLVEHLRSLKL
ncbi:MAG: UTP--glucose-1-phosphate uridylyltransferase GalU [Pyrinomonadaceae bacterium]